MTDRVVVYSCYFGAHEPLNPNSMGDGDGYRRILYSDHADHQIDGVETRVVEDLGIGPAHLSRKPKMCPHLFFDKEDWVIYVDNRAKLKVTPSEIIEKVKFDFGEDAPAGRYLFNHPKRCAYREMLRCKRRELISKEQFKTLHHLFKSHGFPEFQGVFQNTIMVQKLGCSRTNQLNEAWWDLFLRYSKRDQITLPFLLWKMGYPKRVLSFGVRDVANWPVISRQSRFAFQKSAMERDDRSI